MIPIWWILKQIFIVYAAVAIIHSQPQDMNYNKYITIFLVNV